MGNFPYFAREFFKAIGETFTTEEMLILFKLVRALAKAINSLEPDKIDGLAEAYKTGTRLMEHYRETGEP